MKLSIVTTLYRSAQFIEEFYERITRSAAQISEDYELIFVNDGSPDNSLKLAVELFERDEKVKILDLSRNFGHHKAMMAGLEYASGQYIFLIDSDLEEEPELLERFWKEYHDDGTVDVVYGVQKKRKGGRVERILGHLFYRFFNYFSEVEIVANHFCARLMSARYVKALIGFKEYHPLMVGLMFLTGFSMKGVHEQKLHKGKSSYTWRRKTSMAVNSIVSFSAKPLKMLAFSGVVLCLFSVCYILYLACLYIAHGGNIAIGWTSLVMTVAFFGGLNLFALGVIGIYIGKIFEQVKGRPYVIIRSVYDQIEGKGSI